MSALVGENDDSDTGQLNIIRPIICDNKIKAVDPTSVFLVEQCFHITFVEIIFKKPQLEKLQF